jgi:hypothetical protein
MCVNVNFVGQFGNNLFQYAIGRIIAEHLGFELRCQQQLTPMNPMDSGSFTTLKDLIKHFPYAPLYIPGRSYTSPIQSFELQPDSNWDGQIIDLEEVLNDRSPRHIRLSGYFQRYEFLQTHLDKIRHWFWFKEVPTPFNITANDVLVNVRRGIDYGVLSWVLPLSYYEKALSELSHIGNVYVCGTHIDDEVRKGLSRYRPIYFDGTPIEHFSFIARFKRIILANSSFSWWAAFLSNANEIYAPRSRNGRLYAFTGYSGVDLNMRESRYKEIEIMAFANGGIAVHNQSSPELLVLNDGGATVGSLDDPNSRVRIDKEDIDLIEWLVQQRVPIQLTEIIDRCTLVKAMTLVETLTSAGILRIGASIEDNQAVRD